MEEHVKMDYAYDLLEDSDQEYRLNMNYLLQVFL